MKKVVAVLVLSVISTCVFSQSFAPSSSIPEAGFSPVSPVIMQPSANRAYEPNPPGLKIMKSGKTLTILGSAFLIGGIVVLANADEMYYSTGTNGTEGDPKAALGILMVSGGLGMTIPGIILWSKGSKKYKAYQAEQSASFNIKGAGVALKYRF